MKTKQKKELENRTVAELKTMIVKAKEELFSLVLDQRRNKLKNVRLVFTKKKEIAVIFSKMREKELIK